MLFMRTGRPQKFDILKYEALTEEYLDKCKDTYKKLITYRSRSKRWVSERYTYKLQATIPTVQWFAKYCWIHRSTVYDWCKKYPDFSDMVEYVKCVQADKLINGGLSNIYNTQFVVLLLFSSGYLKK